MRFLERREIALAAGGNDQIKAALGMGAWGAASGAGSDLWLDCFSARWEALPVVPSGRLSARWVLARAAGQPGTIYPVILNERN